MGGLKVLYGRRPQAAHRAYRRCRRHHGVQHTAHLAQEAVEAVSALALGIVYGLAHGRVQRWLRETRPQEGIAQDAQGVLRDLGRP